MLHLACYISNGLLALLLAIQQFQHQRIVKGLLDRVLESKGMEALPEDHPIADMVTNLRKEAAKPVSKEQERLVRNAQNRVRFEIPNMPQFKEK